MARERRILVDADACPVKQEVFDAAWRHGVPVRLVAGAYLRHPAHPLIEMVVAGDGFDAADDVIAAAAAPGTLVVTADILLAERCLRAGAVVLDPKGRAFTDASIGRQVADRAIMADLRAGIDAPRGGGKPFSKADRSAFKTAIEAALRTLQARG